MSLDFPRVLTQEEVADVLRSAPEAVSAEFEAGALRGFKIGGKWRMAETDLLSFLGVAPTPNHATQAMIATGHEGPAWRDVQIKWQQTEPITFEWPSRADEEGFNEAYSEVFEGLLVKNGRVHRSKKLLIGFTTRRSAGIENRRRATVFLVRVDSKKKQTSLYPIVEFAGANDYDSTRRLASLIKLPSRRQLRPGEAIPLEYQGFETAVYSEIVNGPNARNGLAVVVRDDDVNGMARHALIRLETGRNGGNIRFDSKSCGAPAGEE